MATRDSSFVSLLPHPDYPGKGVRSVAAGAELAGSESLRFRYVLEADPTLVRIPSRSADAGRTDKLWAHTCFEAFVGLPESPQYLELNFSPSGQWAAYRFDSYRQGMVPALDRAPRVALRSSGERLELQAEVWLSGSPASPGAAAQVRGCPRLRIALSTVVEDREGRLSYWALRHPPGRPDFHHPESFSLALELPFQP
ncbi:MAG: DOMON-like domain-containing protein [Gammaproteobacteria bacterium]|nr:DOMON-like domain-containing protein [Gammaproteobacteria bacterium]MDE2263743.1 DOMON-like domain-containing protein [Gammaproteobacteria bacterium]